MWISFHDPAVRLTGRWYQTDTSATTTTPGAYMECAFTGDFIRLYFDTTDSVQPFPHLWLSVDGGARIEAPVDKYLCVAASEGAHTMTVIFKSADETQARWYAPLVGKVRFLGYEAEGAGVLAPDDRPLIEFVGDSITEGILIDPDYHYNNDAPGACDRTLQDDTAASYAWLTAAALNCRPIYMGYGAVGTTRAGSGKVPRAAESYPYCFNGAPISHKNPALIVVNHGANDVGNLAAYVPGYTELLDVIRARNPESKVVVLSTFLGRFDGILSEFVPKYNRTRNADVRLILAGTWNANGVLHPHKPRHREIAEKLVPLLREVLAEN